MAKTTKKQTLKPGNHVIRVKSNLLEGIGVPIPGALNYTPYSAEQDKVYQKELKQRRAKVSRIMKALSGLSYSEAQSILRECRDGIEKHSIVK